MPNPESPDSNRYEYRSVRDESVRGASVGALLLIAKLVIGIGSLIIFARLLSPEDFGLVAMAGISIGVFRIVGDLGLVMSSTQRGEIDPIQQSTLFWINVAGGVLLSLLAIASGPALVAAFGEGRLFAITSILSLVLIGAGVGAQHEAILRRRLDYGFLQIAGVVAQATGLFVGLICAAVGLGYWSLVLHQLAGRSTQTALFWIRTSWRPGPPRRRVGVKSFLGYGSKMMAAQLLAYLTRSLSDLMVGIASDATNVGFFRRATSIVMVVEELKQPLKAIMPASLSRVQDNPGDFAHFFMNGIALWSLAAFGALGLIISEAPFIVDVLLGDQWTPVVPLVRWLVPAGLAAALGSATEWILMPLGMMKRLVTIRLLRLFAVVIGIVIGRRWGVEGIAIGYSVSVTGILVIELWWVLNLVRGRIGKCFWGILRGAAASVAAVAVAGIVPSSSALEYTLEVVLYAVVFVGVYMILPGGFALVSRLVLAVRRVSSPSAVARRGRTG